MHFCPVRLHSAAIVALFALCLAGCSNVKSIQVPESKNLNLLIAPQTLHSNEVTLIWDKCTEAGSPVSYDILRDGKRLGSTTKTFFTAQNLQPSTPYVFEIVASVREEKRAFRSKAIRAVTKPREQTLDITRFGAKPDGITLNTKSIQAAIDACPENGIVLIPEGIFLTGALFLKSNMTLHIAARGVLKGSSSPADYEPFIPNRFEGWEMDTYASLLNAGTRDHRGPANVHNLSIRGAGKISGGGRALGQAMIDAHGIRSRGRLLCLMNVSGLEIQGVTLEEPPSWTLHYLYCESVSVHGLTIDTDVRNGDGIDPDSSANSYIFNCSFSTGDDCIAIKSGKNPEGNVINRPTENVRIFDCRFTKGHGISIGSEMSGGIRNVLVEDCVAGNLLHGLQIKATKERGGIVENITVRDCELQKISILTSLPYNNDGAAATEPPTFRNFTFRNIDLSPAKPKSAVIIVNGFESPGRKTSEVSFENIVLPAGAIIQVDQCEKIDFRDVRTADGGKPAYEVSRSNLLKGTN